MIGFWHLQRRIQALDYRQWGRVVQALQVLERYTKEAKKYRDFTALKLALDLHKEWLEAVERDLKAFRAPKPVAAPASSRPPRGQYLYPADTLGVPNPLPTSTRPTDKTPTHLQATNLTRTRAALRSLERIF